MLVSFLFLIYGMFCSNDVFEYARVINLYFAGAISFIMSHYKLITGLCWCNLFHSAKNDIYIYLATCRVERKTS